MAKIEKIKKGTATIYPATIPQAVIDPTSGKSARAELDEKANHGYETESKTLKEVDEAKVDKTSIVGETGQGDTTVMHQKAVTDGLALKAAHGYESNPKTLKAVDDELIQLAGDVEQLAYVKIKNEAVNGNFENGLIAPFIKSDGYGGTSTLAINSSTPISGNYDIRLTITTTATSTGRPSFFGLNKAANIGDKIYLHFYAKILSGTPTIETIYNGAAVSSIYRGDVINGRNTRVIDVEGTGSYGGVIYFDSTTAWDMQMDNLMRINLTETFGAGNEPTKEEMDLLISTLGIDYFEGKISIPAQKVMQWQLKMIRQNRNAIVALGGTII